MTAVLAGPGPAGPLTRLARLARFAGEMLRYRVAAMLWLFLLIGAARHGLTDLPLGRLALLTLSVAASYVAATTVNDICDRDIDRVNHPLGKGRPLVHGTADVAQLWQVNAVAAAVTVLAAGLVGGWTLTVAVVSLVLAYAYSLRPLLLSHRPYVAPLVLTFAYVVVPYTHGIALARGAPVSRDALLVPALCLGFLARIVLKDFRDRDGDAAFGKQTLLLRHGRGTVCAVSAVALGSGSTLLVLSLRLAPDVTAAVGLLAATCALQLAALARAADRRQEQVAIGLAARAGNGLLVALLGWLLLDAAGAGSTERGLLLGLCVVVYAGSVLVLARRPEVVLVGYKG